MQLRRRGDGRDGYRRGSGLLCGRCRRGLSGSGRRGSGIGDGRRGVEAGRTGISRHGLRLGRLCGFRRRRTRTGDGRVGPILFRLFRFGLILFFRLFLDSLGLSFFDGKGVLFDFGLCLGLRIGCDFLGGLFDRFGNRLGFLGLGRLDRCGRRNRLGLLGGPIYQLLLLHYITWPTPRSLLLICARRPRRIFAVTSRSLCAAATTCCL